MKKILITAFEPFGEDSTNPTQEILRCLPDRLECRRGEDSTNPTQEMLRCFPDRLECGCGEDSTNPTQEILGSLPTYFDCDSDKAELIKLLLPVSFVTAPKIAADAVMKYRPDAVISLGLAGGRSAVTPEKIAINCMNARIPDNDGYKPEDLPIIQDGVPAYYATLPVKKIRDAIRAEGVPSDISYSAGTYACNCLMYRMLRLAAESDNQFISGFIHVPYIDTMGKTPALSLDEEITAVKAAIRACMDTL